MKGIKNIIRQNASISLMGALVVIGVLGYQYWTLNEQYEVLTAEKVNLENDLRGKVELLKQIEEERYTLQGELAGEKERVAELGEEVSEITETVEELEKLAETDPELLQKYSKVFFLNEHYVPPELANVDEQYVWGENREVEVHDSVWPYLEDMLLDAAEDDINLYVVSGYRSFGEQSSLKSNYKVLYGSGANQFSADQGYSEHQLGTTVDLTTEVSGGGFTNFDKTTAYAWLQENAYRYGFILSYPKDNSYYVFEPWHWRFVGRKLARKLHRDELNFYDLDQRVIDEYLISIFD